ncbi:MAG: C_GCAxxG_C_C family protein [Atopobiaceae bacterium]|nr:C_GCAxxG_C_C family protein [Atopobiaceae bacterium]
MAGYNCSQSVVLAFDDVLAEHGIDAATMARLSSPFGGGMGRMREVCGAVSGMLMVLGVVEGYDDPKAFGAKKALYARVQEIAGAYREENGSIVCRELLGLGKGPSEATPEKRTDAYYRKRPCPDLCACAARILAEHLE